MSDSSVEIQHWINQLQRGDEQARAALLECACARLTRLTRKMLRDFARLKRWEQTDDVLQSAALRLCRALRETTPPTARDFFRLAAVHIRRELIDLARHHFGPRGSAVHHHSRDPDHDSPPEPAASSSQAPDQMEDWAAFHELVAALPDDEREVFDLLWYQGLPQVEAALVLGVSPRTIKRRWQDARLRLYRQLHE
jgi:RNA polymerase sigma-70 factor (ECF subfamily)